VSACEFRISAPAGNDAFSLTILGARKPLATGTTTATVQQPFGQELHLLFHGIVGFADITIDNPNPAVGKPATARIGVVAYDATHEQIPGDDFASPLSMDVANQPAAVHLSGTEFTSPDSKITLSYSGAPMPAMQLSALGDPATNFYPNPYREFGAFAVPVRFVAAGGDGNVWFLEIDDIAHLYRKGRVTPAGATTQFIPPGSAREITAGPGAMWFTDSIRGAIGRITYDGKITEYPVISNPGIDPLQSITLGPDGNLWFTSAYEVGKISPAGKATLYPVGLLRGFSIVSGPDGNLWWTNTDLIGRTTPTGQTTLYYSDKVDPDARMVFRPDKLLYFLGDLAYKAGLYTIDLSGKTALVGTGAGIYPPRLTVDKAGNLWASFTANPSYANFIPGIARLSIPYAVLQYPFVESQPNQFTADDVTVGPDGNIWYADATTRSVGRLQIH
jgi:streptogramin lyase